MNWIFLNGRIVTEPEAVISVLDRGFLYGDGLFETMRVCQGRIFRWGAHWRRLQSGGEFLGIRLPATEDELHQSALELVRRNELADAFLRITQGADHPTVTITTHPMPESNDRETSRWRLITSSIRVAAGEPLTQFKTCNKLAQIMARAEADAARANEALVCNTDGFVVEASSSNLFWLQGQTVCTPPVASGILPGVTRTVVFELCQALAVPPKESLVRPDQLQESDGVFLSLSTAGIAPAIELDGKALPVPDLVRKLRAAYQALLLRETAGSGETAQAAL
jgi:branched-subunit amino acid aminotransferase/4-amino-4-deoxychorismate lyase